MLFAFNEAANQPLHVAHPGRRRVMAAQKNNAPSAWKTACALGVSVGAFAALPLLSCDSAVHSSPKQPAEESVSIGNRASGDITKSPASPEMSAIRKTVAVFSDSDDYTTDAAVFAVPGIMHHVHFWVEIWTQLSRKQGLLHDKRYPAIIYQRLDLSDIPPSQWRKHVRLARNLIIHRIDNMLAAPESLWTEEQREIAAKFDLYASRALLQGATRRIRWQRGLRERFLAGLARSGAYLDTIFSILAEYGVPQELAYLPHVESSFNPAARSRVGALGMWQIMDYTGRHYMRIDSVVDERLDPIAATRAAAKILRHNYDTLKSWPLAVTAYNHGLRGVLRAIEKTDTNDLAVIMREYKHGMFGFASRNFYSSFVAANLVAQNAGAYFDSLKLHPPFRAKIIQSLYRVPAAILCDYFDVPVDTFRAYNPALLDNVFDENGGIPVDYALNLPSYATVSVQDKIIWSVPPELRPGRERRGYRVVVNQRDGQERSAGFAAETGFGTRLQFSTPDQSTRDAGSASLFAFPLLDSVHVSKPESAFVQEKMEQDQLLAEQYSPESVGL